MGNKNATLDQFRFKFDNEDKEEPTQKSFDDAMSLNRAIYKKAGIYK